MRERKMWPKIGLKKKNLSTLSPFSSEIKFLLTQPPSPFIFFSSFEKERGEERGNRPENGTRFVKKEEERKRRGVEEERRGVFLWLFLRFFPQKRGRQARTRPWHSNYRLKSPLSFSSWSFPFPRNPSVLRGCRFGLLLNCFSQKTERIAWFKKKIIRQLIWLGRHRSKGPIPKKGPDFFWYTEFPITSLKRPRKKRNDSKSPDHRRQIKRGKGGGEGRYHFQLEVSITAPQPQNGIDTFSSSSLLLPPGAVRKRI